MARQHKQRFNKQRTQLGGWNAVLRIFLEPPNQKHKPPMQQLTMSHAEHASSLEHVKPTRENNGVPDPRKQLHGSSRSATYANRRGKPVSYTQATEATTNHENEPRRAALNMKRASSEGKRWCANPGEEAQQQKQQKCGIRKQKQQARPAHTHRQRASSKSTAGGAKHRTQELST